MKANELIIGDWIEPHQCRIPTVYARVEGIYPDGITIDKAERVFSFDEIHPIPLTPEILEKNGFRIIFEGELHVSYFQDIESFHIEVKVDKIGIYQKLSMLDGLGNGVTIVECKYVHQLQHALRLCGIDKTIEL